MRLAGPVSVLALFAFIAQSCARPLVHPCSNDVECAVGWSCVTGSCAPTPEDGGSSEPVPRDAPSADRNTRDRAGRDVYRSERTCGDGALGVCDDRRPCQRGNCDPETGTCVYAAADDGTTCDDGDMCNPGRYCVSGVCGPGNPVHCDDSADPCQVASCNRATGCVLTAARDGKDCDDGISCTAGDACAAGVCHGIPMGSVVSGDTTTRTCPAETTAVNGYVTPDCTFIGHFEPNAMYTGPVYLVSHLDRGDFNYDINPLGGGMIQLVCVYADADGRLIGATTALFAASSCTATADSFVCAM